MARTQLDLLKEEISHYLGIPYFSNTLKINSPDRVRVGKGTWSEIKPLLSEPNIGIDCSGLVYHLLDFWAKLKYGFSIEKKVIGTENQFGPRRVSANLFTSPINSIPVTDIQTGDLIRLDNGRHVMFIIEQKDNLIYYVHSSENEGVHLGVVSSNMTKWSDLNYARRYHPSLGDGIFRLKCFI